MSRQRFRGRRTVQHTECVCEYVRLCVGMRISVLEGKMRRRYVMDIYLTAQNTTEQEE
jgi:hypothetical protein